MATKYIKQGIYTIPPHLCAKIQNGEIIVKHRVNLPVECNRCRDCKYLKTGIAWSNMLRKTDVCILRPKKKKCNIDNVQLFYAKRPYYKACDQFEHI